MIRKKIKQFKIKIISLFQTIIYKKENDRTDRYSSFCQYTNLKSYLKMVAFQEILELKVTTIFSLVSTLPEFNYSLKFFPKRTFSMH